MKKLIVALTMLTMFFSFAGCSEKSNQTDGEGDNAKDVDFSIVNERGLNCSNEKGYYYIGEDSIPLKNASVGYRMMYMDYETKKEIYLCNRPGCEHDSENCPAVFSDQEILPGSSLFYYDGYLYLFAHDQDQSGGWSIDHNESSDAMDGDNTAFVSTPASLYRMNPDGTDRKKVYTFDEALSLEDLVMASGDSLYFITKKVSSKEVDDQTTYFASSERELVRLGLRDWKIREVCELDTDASIIGAFGNHLVMQQTIFDHELSDKEMMDDNQYIDAYQKSYASFAVLNITDGKTEEVAKAENKKINTYEVAGDCLYLSTEGENKIEQINLQTKKKRTLAETADSCIDEAYDDVLRCSSWSAEDGEKTDFTMCFVNLQDGSIEKSGLKMTSMEGDIQIRAELADQFLVLYDYDAKKDPMYEGQYNLNGAKYALISKKDLYTGKSNYQTIDLISSGMGIFE